MIPRAVAQGDLRARPALHGGGEGVARVEEVVHAGEVLVEVRAGGVVPTVDAVGGVGIRHKPCSVLIRLSEWRPILPPPCCCVLPPTASSDPACHGQPSARRMALAGSTRSSTTATGSWCAATAPASGC